MTLHRPTIAGITIPRGALARAATEFVRDTASQLLFDHSRACSYRPRRKPAGSASTPTPNCSTSERCSTTSGPRCGSCHSAYDILGAHFDTLTPEQRDEVLAAHPRTDIKTELDPIRRRRARGRGGRVPEPACRVRHRSHSVPAGDRVTRSARRSKLWRGTARTWMLDCMTSNAASNCQGSLDG